ncbi:MAG: hypothetical protein AAYR33_09400 [Acetobacteraceae bacterium]
MHTPHPAFPILPQVRQDEKIVAAASFCVRPSLRRAFDISPGEGFRAVPRPASVRA